MRYARWLDHLPPWASWGALAISEVFTGRELAYMAFPLLIAAAVEAAGLNLSRWRRLVEVACLLGLVLCRLARLGWVIVIILLLFMLCGARLALPREPAQRRQIVFMSFLLFLLTAVANTSISFLPMALLWTAIAAAALLQLNWEKRPVREGAALGMPPLKKAITWTIAAAAISSGLFLILPRPVLRWRPLPFGVHGFFGATAGLSDSLSLEGSGEIRGNTEVVARILPPAGISEDERKAMESRMPLLIGFYLESPVDGRWERARRSPRRRDVWELSPLQDLAYVEYFVYPTPTGLIPMPYGRLNILPPSNMRIDFAGNGVTRWSYPIARPMPFHFVLDELRYEPVTETQIGTRGLLDTDPTTIEALRWSLGVAPETVGAGDLAHLLSSELQAFRYTLRNPSGGAKDPLGDFLNRSKAGHCEYFAHALASALRYRGVASRVVNGYRLGQWIEEGGYWLVTQDQAHSWVEYADPEAGAWMPIDPTPPGSASYHRRWLLTEKISRTVDAMRFRWDRYVVRFSDAEQLKGLAWAQSSVSKMWSLRPNKTASYTMMAVLAVLFLLPTAWKRGGWGLLFRGSVPSGAVLALRPLIRASGIQPGTGETIRGWFTRLCAQCPERSGRLLRLAELVEGRVYGGTGADIATPIKDEAREWRRERGRPGPNSKCRAQF